MRLKQDSIIALKPELFEFLEIRSSQAPSACADVRIVESSSETDPLGLRWKYLLPEGCQGSHLLRHASVVRWKFSYNVRISFRHTPKLLLVWEIILEQHIEIFARDFRE